MNMNVLVFCIFLVTVNSNKLIITSVIKEFFVLQQRVSQVTIYQCWSKGEVINLLKILSKINILSSALHLHNFHHFPVHIPEEHQFYIIDWNCPTSKMLLEHVEENKLFNQPYRWLLLSNSTSFASFQQFHISFSSEFYILGMETKETYWIRSYYKYSNNSSMCINNVAQWSVVNHFKYYNKLSSLNRSNLWNSKLRVSMVFINNDSLNHLWDYRDVHIDGLSKVNYILLHYLSHMLNASLSFIRQNSWGAKELNGTKYSGMIGDIQTNKADIGGTSAFIVKERLAVVDYVASTYPTKHEFIFRSPPLSIVKNVFVYPFDISVWKATFISILLLFCILYAIVYWEWKDTNFREHVKNDSSSLSPNKSAVLMLEISAISQQGSYNEPKSNSGRIVTIVMFIILMFMYTSYSANIIVLLQSSSDSIKTIEDLQTSRISLGVEDVVYSYYYFENEKEPKRKLLYETKIAPKGEKPKFYELKEGIKKVQNEFFAFHVDIQSGYKIIKDIFYEHEKCELKEIDIWNLAYPWMIVAKNSSYKEIIKINMKRLQERGMFSREIRKFYISKPKCDGRIGNFKSVSLIDANFAFTILLTGIALSIGIVTVEIIFHRYKKLNARDDIVFPFLD